MCWERQRREVPAIMRDEGENGLAKLVLEKPDRLGVTTPCGEVKSKKLTTQGTPNKLQVTQNSHSVITGHA